MGVKLDEIKYLNRNKNYGKWEQQRADKMRDYLSYSQKNTIIFGRQFLYVYFKVTLAHSFEKN